MALKFNSTTISPSYTPKFNSTALKSIKFGSTEVWSGQLVVFNGSSFDSSAGGWVDVNGSSVGTISGEALSRSFTSYINDRTKNQIDLTPWPTLTVVVNSFSSGSSRTPFLIVNKSNPGNLVNDASGMTAYTAMTKTKTQATYTVNISGLSGSYYIYIAMGMGGSYNSSYSIKSITLS